MVFKVQWKVTMIQMGIEMYLTINFVFPSTYIILPPNLVSAQKCINWKYDRENNQSIYFWSPSGAYDKRLYLMWKDRMIGFITSCTAASSSPKGENLIWWLQKWPMVTLHWKLSDLCRDGGIFREAPLKLVRKYLGIARKKKELLNVRKKELFGFVQNITIHA